MNAQLFTSHMTSRKGIRIMICGYSFMVYMIISFSGQKITFDQIVALERTFCEADFSSSILDI